MRPGGWGIVDFKGRLRCGSSGPSGALKVARGEKVEEVSKASKDSRGAVLLSRRSCCLVACALEKLRRLERKSEEVRPEGVGTSNLEAHHEAEVSMHSEQKESVGGSGNGHRRSPASLATSIQGFGLLTGGVGPKHLLRAIAGVRPRRISFVRRSSRLCA